MPLITFDRKEKWGIWQKCWFINSLDRFTVTSQQDTHTFLSMTFKYLEKDRRHLNCQNRNTWKRYCHSENKWNFVFPLFGNKFIKCRIFLGIPSVVKKTFPPLTQQRYLWKSQSFSSELSVTISQASSLCSDFPQTLIFKRSSSLLIPNTDSQKFFKNKPEKQEQHTHTHTRLKHTLQCFKILPFFNSRH